MPRMTSRKDKIWYRCSSISFLLLCWLLLYVESAAQPLAFPGAEGFGKFTTGGRGGKVLIVNNLKDSGPGSFREAAEAKFPRIIVFQVSGTIRLLSPLRISKNVTIAGQTAPGDGICLADQPVQLIGDNIIMRFIRIRMGDRYQRVDTFRHGTGHDDALSATRRKNIIIDHCSLSWSTDEVCSIYAGDSTTLQWNMIYEPLNYSYHFEKGDKDFEEHGYGGIWGGQHFSAWHNIIASAKSRTPRFDGIRNAPTERVDFRNNVIYNWGINNMYAGEGGEYNIVANYYKPGPNTAKKVVTQLVNPGSDATHGFGSFFVQDNFIEPISPYAEQANLVNKNNWAGVLPKVEKGVAPTEEWMKKQKIVVDKIFATVPPPTVSAQQAYRNVQVWAGAVLPNRDTLDQRIIVNMLKGSGKIIDVQGGFPHGTPFEQTLVAWPSLQSSAPLLDSDQDGMPDDWELKHGLQPNNPEDALLNTLHPEYNNIEVYLNALVQLPKEVAQSLTLPNAGVNHPEHSALPMSHETMRVAFPGAEGYGKYTSGGRAGKVIYVTTLNDNGKGSLREAIAQKGPRTILFKVSGNILLEKPLVIQEADLTIAGQSAPGEGICLSQQPVIIQADNIIIRYLRIRLGDQLKSEGDCLSARKTKNVIIDHCSFSWGTDENVGLYDNIRFTLQWCIISESLNASVHQKGEHGYGAIWGGYGASFHHNLIAHHKSRVPRLSGTSRMVYRSEEAQQVDYYERSELVNNVFFNWGINNTYGGESGTYLLLNNIYKPGPATGNHRKKSTLNPSAPYGAFQVSGNKYFEGNLSADKWEDAPIPAVDSKCLTNTLGPSIVEPEEAAIAYQKVLKNAGAVHQRDAIDRRIIKEVIQGSASLGRLKNGIIDRMEEAGGLPVLKSALPPVDTDEDGMPDDWEQLNELNPNDPSDGSKFSLTQSFTNLEVYLHRLCKPATWVVEEISALGGF
jgi:hypothetical protein